MSEACLLKVAVVATSGHVGRVVRETLARDGFEPQGAADITSVIAASRRSSFQALVLEDTAGKLDDWLAAFQLHAAPAAAVVVVGLRRPQGFADLLSRGATDYLEVSAVPMQLAPRLRARIASLRTVALGGLPPSGPYVLDERVSALRAGLREVCLTRCEFALARALFAHQGSAVSLATIALHVWGPARPVSPRMVEQHVGSLRRKLAASACRDVFIRAVTGIGYRLDVEPGTPATDRRRLAGPLPP